MGLYDPLISFVDENNLYFINRDAKVHKFIDQETKEWNLRSIVSFLPSNVLADIKAILIPFSPIEDRIIWGYSQDGNFNLRSATWVMRRALTHPRSKLLNWIWKSKLLPKIKFFLWLLIRNALPTCDFLIVRRMEIPNGCYLCDHNIENIDHVFKKCPFVISIWDRIKYNCPTPLFYEGDFLSWLEMIYKNYKTNCKLFNHPMEKIGIIMWNVWNHRNHVVFKKMKLNPFLVIEKATLIFRNLQEYIFYPDLHNEGRNVSRMVEKWIRWIRPINNRFKLNFDGSRVQNISALGWVIRDSNGIIKMAAFRHIGNSSIIVAECMELRDSMLAAKRKGFLNLEIQGD